MNILSVFAELLAQSGFAAITWQQCVMLLVSFVLLYLAIKKQFEPLLLLPIARYNKTKDTRLSLIHILKTERSGLENSTNRVGLSI